MLNGGGARLVNIAIQGSTLSSRFLLVFFLARFLAPEQLGLYGLIVATISYALFVIGFDFYTYATRELIKREKNEWASLLKSQCGLWISFYALFMPVLCFLFAENVLPWSIAGWFFVLLVLEHLTQEVGRLLIALSEPLTASLVLFIRHGSWAIGVVALMALDPKFRSLALVLGSWTLAAAVALAFGAYRLSTLGICWWVGKVDWAWIRVGLKVCIPMFVATLALRGIYTLDRYWLNEVAGLEVVGAYVLFAGISGALMTFLDAGVFSFGYPGLIKAVNEKDSHQFVRQLQTLAISTGVVSAVFAVASVFFLDPLLSWTNNASFAVHSDFYPWLLLASILYALGMVPHYALYAQGFDRPIIISHIATFFIFVGIAWAFSSSWGAKAVPVGLCAALAVLLAIKLVAFLKLTPLPFRSVRFRARDFA